MPPRYSISRAKSCLECIRRKIKCDRAHPCSSCVREKLECHYKPRYSSDVNGVDGNEELSHAATDAPQAAHVDGHGKNNDASANLWANIAEEVRNYAGFVLESSSTAPRAESAFPSLLLGSTPSSSTLRPLHPSEDNVHFFWQTYLENVDPLLKIFHLEIIHKRIWRFFEFVETDAHVEALLFSLYYAAVITLRPDECMERCGEARQRMLERYRYALEQALFRSDFMINPTIISLQAFVLYLITARYSLQPLAGQSLLALAIHLARRLSLDQDQKYGIDRRPRSVTVLDSEMGRRLWWHILTLDVRTAEDAGTDPLISEDSWTTPLPRNVEDSELSGQDEALAADFSCLGQTIRAQSPQLNTSANVQIGTLQSAAIAERKPAMTFPLLRFEMSHAVRKVSFSQRFSQKNGYEVFLSSRQRANFLNHLKTELDDKYLHLFQGDDPFSFFGRNSANMVLGRVMMVAVQNPGTTWDGDTQAHLLDCVDVETLQNCVHVLEAALVLRKYAPIGKWTWLLSFYIELDILALLWMFLVRNVTSDPNIVNDDKSQRAWRLAEGTFVEWRDNIEGIRQDRRWSWIETLRCKAFAARIDDKV